MNDNQAILAHQMDKIGMHRYGWGMFVVCGLGFAVDNIFIQAVSSIQIPLQLEFNLSNTNLGVLTSALPIGMLIGSTLCGILSDVYGRLSIFTISLWLSGITALVSAVARTPTTIFIAISLLGVFIGGNIPIDAALFLESIPNSKHSLLTLLSAFWPIGQIITSICAFLIIPNSNLTCSDSTNCPFSSNVGWRILQVVLGSLTLLMAATRLFLFNVQESPMFLVTKQRFKEAVRVLNAISNHNGTSISEIRESDFHCDTELTSKPKVYKIINSMLGPQYFRTTILVWLIWIFVSLGNNIFFAFITKFISLNAGNVPLSTGDTYRNYLIISFLSVFGSVIGMYSSDSFLGRKYTLGLSTMLLSIILFCLTIFTSSPAQLTLTILASITQTSMYHYFEL